jgi:hypothetical protein
MGFTIQTYNLLGLQNIQNLYVSIRGSYNIQKCYNQITGIGYTGPNFYTVSYIYYFQASPTLPIITQQNAFLKIETLPTPADLYTSIYEQVKLILDPNFNTPQQTLVFTDDIFEITQPITDPTTTPKN